VCARYFELCAAWRRLLCVASTAPQTSVQRIRRTDGACASCGLSVDCCARGLLVISTISAFVDLSWTYPSRCRQLGAGSLVSISNLRTPVARWKPTVPSAGAVI